MWGYVPHTPTREFLPGPGSQLCLDLGNQRFSVWSGETMWGYAPHAPTREFLPGPGTQGDLGLRNRRVSV